jgi:Leucine-rich repeat (LRR) protein
MMCIHCSSYLSHNQLSSLPAGLFDKLTNVRQLSVDFLMCTHCFSQLHNNKLSSLPAGLFDQLTNLQEL